MLWLWWKHVYWPVRTWVRQRWFLKRRARELELLLGGKDVPPLRPDPGDPGISPELLDQVKDWYDRNTWDHAYMDGQLHTAPAIDDGIVISVPIAPKPENT